MHETIMRRMVSTISREFGACKDSLLDEMNQSMRLFFIHVPFLERVNI